MSKDLTVRFRVDFGSGCSLGIGKIELLEHIASSGSLSQAARRMHMSYRRAWLLLSDMNSSFDEPVALASTGGRGGGGVVLTELGERLVAGYRNMESALAALVGSHFQDFGERARSPREPELHKPVVPVTSIRRKAVH